MRFLATLLIGGLAGLVATHASAYEPESGLWWNPSESGTGYALEVQDDFLAVTVYGGAQNGNAKWYTSAGRLTYANGGVRFEEDLLGFFNVQPIGQPWHGRPTLEPSYGKLRIVFDPNNSRRAMLTWPNGRSIPIQRHEFYLQRPEDTGGVTIDTTKMLGEWQVVADVSSSGPSSFPFSADMLVLDDYGYDNDPSLRTWVYEGCRPDNGQVGGCSNNALNNHDAYGYFEAPSNDFPNGVQVIVLKDGPYDGRMWYALYEIAIGTNDGSGLFTLYPQGTNPYGYEAYPARAFRTASRTFVQEGSGPAKQGDDGKAPVGGLAAQLAARGVLPVEAKAISPERAERAVARLPLIRALEARLAD